MLMVEIGEEVSDVDDSKASMKISSTIYVFRSLKDDANLIFSCT